MSLDKRSRIANHACPKAVRSILNPNQNLKTRIPASGHMAALRKRRAGGLQDRLESLHAWKSGFCLRLAGRIPTGRDSNIWRISDVRGYTGSRGNLHAAGHKCDCDSSAVRQQRSLLATRRRTDRVVGLVSRRQSNRENHRSGGVDGNGDAGNDWRCVLNFQLDYPDSAVLGRQHRKRVLIHRHGRDCAYCGCTIKHKNITVDHVVPRSRGGSDELGNLRIACPKCNQMKADRTPQQWAADILRHFPRQSRRRFSFAALVAIVWGIMR